VDEALRAALRSDDWTERAAAYRRAGEADRARREVARAARAELEGARHCLEEFALDADARALLEVLAGPRDPAQRWAAQILWGDGDPRLAAAAEDWVDRSVRSGQEDEAFGHLMISDYVERLRRFLGAGGPALERTQLSGGEGLALLSRTSQDHSACELLQLHFLAEQSQHSGFAEAVAERIVGHRYGSRVQAVLGPEPGRAGGSFHEEEPWRPSWVRPLLRDPRTLALSHHALRGRHLAPGALELPNCAWVALFAVDLRGAEGDHLPRGPLWRAVEETRRWLGDRVVRWAEGNRFVVPIEQSDALERAQRWVQNLARKPPGVSAALLSKAQADEVEAWPLVLEEGLAKARERGPGSLEVIEG
jgi:hypothetical protein